MNYLMDIVTDQRKQEKAKAEQNLGLGIGIGAVLGLGIGIMIAPKSGRETMNDIRNAMNTARTQTGMQKSFEGNNNYKDLGNQSTEFAQEYGVSESQGNNSLAGSANSISQGNSIIGNMNPAGKKTKIFAAGESQAAGRRMSKNAARESSDYEFAKDYSLSGAQSSHSGSNLDRDNSSVCDNQSDIGTIYSMDNSSYNDAMDESNYTKIQKGGSYEAGLNYGPSNIQADSHTQNKAGGTVSQSEAKSLDTSNTDIQAGGSAAGFLSGGEAGLGNTISSPINSTGGSQRSNALKRSTRASLKNRGQ